jgi:hypothetical protein
MEALPIHRWFGYKGLGIGRRSRLFYTMLPKKVVFNFSSLNASNKKHCVTEIPSQCGCVDADAVMAK